MTEAVPDETTLCKFRHLLEANGLNKLFFDAINRVMVQTGHMMKGGTIVDATIINAPSSTNRSHHNTCSSIVILSRRELPKPAILHSERRNKEVLS